MRVLVLNDFLADWTGSEIVALEVAEHFGATTSSLFCAEPLKSNLKDWRPIEEIDLADFDLVWAQQHALFPLLDKMEDQSPLPAIVWVSLSPYDVMDIVPRSILDAYADEVVCNSRETAAARGVGSSFGNAAPNPFHFERPHRQLQNILFVSNHQPPELLEAEQLLRSAGYRTRFLGRNREFKRLEPDDVAWADCVVTIGKTVRYALASATPVFMYDRFGGDGYLTGENYAANEANNFSGRPVCRQLSAGALAEEIIRNHRFWRPPPQPKLGNFLDQLPRSSTNRRFVRHPELEAIAAMSSAIGSWTAQAYAWKRTADAYDSRQISWHTIRRLNREKFLRSRLVQFFNRGGPKTSQAGSGG